jgi:hypothetical protein
MSEEGTEKAPDPRAAIMAYAHGVCERITAARTAEVPRGKPVHVEASASKPAQTYWLSAAEYDQFRREMRSGGPVRAPNRHERRAMKARVR